MLIPMVGETLHAVETKPAEFARASRKQKKYAKKFKKLRKTRNKATKHRGMNKHHILNACRSGTSTSENLLWLYIEKHNLIHQIFRNDDPEYIIMVLDRMMTMKGYKRFRGVKVVQDVG